MADATYTNALLEQITQQGEALKNGTPGAREALVNSAQQLQAHLLTPAETMIYTQWFNLSICSALRVATDLGIFPILAADNGSPKHLNNIITTPPAEPALIGRMLRLLAAAGIVREPAPDTFVPAAFALAMAQEQFQDSCTFMTDFFSAVLFKTNDFVKSIGYKAPSAVTHTPFHLAYDAPPIPIWAWFAEAAPLTGKQFAGMMNVYTQGRPTWWQPGYYPLKERLIEGFDSSPDSVFLVDIGSGAGHDATRLLQDLGKEIPGKVVIEDRPEVIALAEQSAAPEITKLAHDFFEEQPVKGARAYYLHSIIHDWPDSDSHKILRAIVPAMKAGYSKLLINDCVLANQGAGWLLTSLDWLVMSGLSARERTEAEFETLLKGVGLRITGIWKHPQGLDSLIEAELA